MAILRERWRAGAAAVAIEAALVVLLGWGLAPAMVHRLVAPALEVVAVPPSPPPAPRPPPRIVARASGRAAPPARHAIAAPVVAPPPVVPLVVPPPPIAVAIVAGTGSAPTAGAAPAGSGSGAGGEGDGSGAGGDGDGDGGGRHAVFLRGRIRDGDYPRDAIAASAQGALEARYVIGTDGRVKDCRVTRSSGSMLLDDVTCRLVMERFRFRPARDGAGRKVEDVLYEEHRWVIDDQP